MPSAEPPRLARPARFAALSALSFACVGMGGAGFAVSNLRAGPSSFEDRPVIADGGKPGRLLGDSAKASTRADGYRLSALSVFSNVALHVKDHYVDPERVHPKDMLLAALEQIEREIAEVLVEEPEPGRITITVMGTSMTLKNDVKDLWEINLELREVFRFLEKHLPPQDDLRQIEYAAINGALSTLDPHSVLLEPQAFEEMRTSTKGEFGGLGIVISVRNNKLTVVSPIADTPAARVGLEAGDVISRIGDVSTVSMPVDEAVRMLRGPKGSKAIIWVERETWPEAKRFEIIRERIKLESVESELLSSNVGYIRIKNFQQNTSKDLEDHLSKLQKSSKGKLKGLVLDLRNNPGGLLEQATRVSDKFISTGDIVTTVGYGDRLREPKRARWTGTEAELPIAVLVNRGSASASEIVAGALKNLDRATIIGETSFGKGSVQVLYDFADASALKLTIAQYLTPGDISIQNEGVEPDIALVPNWISKDGLRMYYSNDDHREAALDKHLDRAGRRVSQEPAAYTLRYLVPETNPDKDAPEDRSMERDPQVGLARDYLLAAGAPSRKKSLARGKRFAAERGRKEAAAIAARLGELEVDWSAGGGNPAGLAAKLEVSGHESTGAELPVNAGVEIELVATLTNEGRQPVHRVHGILASDNGAFEGREFVFGKLAPGETRSWKVGTRLPSDAAARVDTVTLQLFQDGEAVEGGTELRIRTVERPSPRFGFNWVLDDRKRGDGDGVLEDGEGVEFRVLVTNLGEGDAKSTALRLKSAAQENLFLERGRVTIGEIAAGATVEGKLRFRVADETKGAPLPLELSVYDPDTGAWLEARFELRASKPVAAQRAEVAGLRKIERDTTLLRAADEGSEVIGTLKAGQVVQVLERHDRFTRVALPTGEASAFVRVAALGRGPKRGEAKPEIAFHPSIEPPRIVLDDSPGGRLLAGDSVRLKGRVEGRAVRDMYVLVNENKVFFDRVGESPASSGEAGPEVDGWQAPNEQAVVLPFELNLTLQPGLNEVVLVGRRDETIIAQQVLFVARAGSSAVAAAEKKAGSDD